MVSALLALTLAQDPISSIAEGELDDAVRVKRSGTSIISTLQKNVFGASAQLSAGSSSSVTSGIAGLSSGSSGSSSGHDNGHESGHGYETGHSYEESHDSKGEGFDGWSLKKSIMNTLLQAVKAIAGGITALKGQLIKGSGYLVSASGKVLASGGDSVTNAGKNIIESAHLVKPEYGNSHGHGHGHSSGGHGGSSLGASLGSSFAKLSSGITSGISGIAAGSSSSSASSSSHLSSSSSAHGSGSSSGSHDTGSSHGEYASAEKPDHYAYEPESPSYQYNSGSGAKPIVQEYYGPPKPTLSYLEQPHSIYGNPSYDDSSNTDILHEIMKNIPSKHAGGYNANQYSLPSTHSHIPFKPIKTFQSSSHTQSLSTAYGTPVNYNSYDQKGAYSNPKQSYIDPKAYDIYHSMNIKFGKQQQPKFAINGPLARLSPNTANVKLGQNQGGHYEIQKSIQYEIKA
ncbi:unnamed protein product [Diamesa serratosioi]